MAQFKKPSKKATIITAAVIIVLLIIAATGTVMFLKDRGTTEAAEIGQEQVSTQNENTGSQTAEDQSSGEATAPEEQSTSEEVATQGEEETGAAGETATEGTTQTGTQGTTSTGTTTGETTTTTEDIQESTITRTDVVETVTVTPWENQNLGWDPSGVDADFARAGLSTLNVQEDDVIVTKSATTKTGEGLVQEGEQITYTITVTNNSEKDVEVKDRIPEQTTYVDGSVENAEISEDGTVIFGTAKAGEVTVITFKVTVNAGATRIITNVAVANGEESDPTETTIVKITKSSEVKTAEGATVEDNVAKVGDKITYTISVENTGDETETVNVKDVELSELISNGTLEVEEDSKATADKLMNGTDVTVPAGETVELEFTTEVLKVDGAITNVVTAGDNDSTDPEDPITTDTVETKGLLVEKTVIDQKEEPYKYGETVRFEVTVDNIGSTTLTNIVVTDNLEGATLVSGNSTIATLTPDDEPVTLVYEYVVQESDVERGYFVNGVTATSGDVAGEDETDEIPVDQVFGYTINYVEKGNETNVLGTETGTADYGDTVNIPSKTFEGYTYDSQNKPNIVITVEDNTAIVYYVAKPEPSLQLTKTAMKDGRKIGNIVYNPASNNNTFIYRLTVENTVADSYPAIITDTQTVTDILPEGITVSGSLPAGVRQETVKNRQKLTWTVNNIGYGDAAKSVDITVSIDKTVFKNKEVDLGNETTVLDIRLGQYTNDKPTSKTDSTRAKMNLFIRTAGETEDNEGYIYAGSVTVGKTVGDSQPVFASNEFNNDDAVDAAVNNPESLKRMYNDFVAANEPNGMLQQYVTGGLPDEAAVNRTLSTLYTDKYGNPVVTLSDTQVILWYKVSKHAKDPDLTRYYSISDGRRTTEHEVNIPAATYHLDGIVVDVSDLGTVIPTGAQVNVTNTAELVGITGNKLSDSATVSIHYKEQKSTYSMNLLSTIINDEELSEEKADEIAAKADELDKANSVVASEEKDDEATAVEKEENTASDNNSSQETTDSTDKEESKPEEEKPTTPTPPAKEESTEQDDITSSDDKNKNESAVESVEQQTLDSQEE